MYWGGYWGAARGPARVRHDRHRRLGRHAAGPDQLLGGALDVQAQRPLLHDLRRQRHERLRHLVQLRLPAVRHRDQPDRARGPTAASCSTRSRSTTNHAGDRRVQRPVVHGLPHRERARRRQLPPLGGRRPDVLQRRRHHAAGHADHRRSAAEPGQRHRTGTNIAPSATRSTSYVSSWENLAAINDGVRADQLGGPRRNLAYGNWPQQGTQWVEYAWPSARSLNRAPPTGSTTTRASTCPRPARSSTGPAAPTANVPGQSAVRGGRATRST